MSAAPHVDEAARAGQGDFDRSVTRILRSLIACDQVEVVWRDGVRRYRTARRAIAKAEGADPR